MIGRVDRWWQALPTGEKARVHGVVLCMALFLVHYVLLSGWYIEDAAITFTYARHLADGEGFVAWPGGEQVEGFSNPTWTLLLAASDLVGLNPWIAAKLYGALFGLLTLPLAYVWARRLAGDHGLLPVLAPLLLAVSPQLAIWNASGLENGLVNLCLAAACVGMLREHRVGGFPWSAVPLGILAFTRPDAPLYCAVAAGLMALFALRARGLAALRWVFALAALSLAPWLAWEAFSWAWFAWPFPNTYYAKQHTMDRFEAFGWSTWPWRYTRAWALETGWGFFVPLAGPLAGGLRGSRAAIGLAVGLLLGLLLLPGLDWPRALVDWSEPEVLVQARVLTLATAAALLPLLGLGRRGDTERTLAWYLVVAAVFFALYAGGDWMDGHRWYATAQVPLAVLLTDLVARAFEVAPGRRRLALGLLAGPIVAASVAYSARFLDGLETSPYDVYQRVRYMEGVQRRLHLDHVVVMEVDFGAQMWWTGDELLDMAGLNDVAIAHRRWEHAFVREYVFEEREPDFAHVHSSWARTAGMRRQAVFRNGYVEIPPYPSSRRWFHTGNHVRRDHLVKRGWTGVDGRGADFGEVQLAGLDLPVREVAAGQGLYLEIGWAHRARRGHDVRPVLFLAGEGRLLTFDLPPAHGWVEAKDWRRGEVLYARHTLPLPADLPPGGYDLGLAVLDADGRVLPASEPSADPRYATGEVRWDGLIEVVPLADAEARVAAGRSGILGLLADGRCEEADARLQIVRRHLAPDHPAQPRGQPEVVDAFARCWALRAEDLAEADLAEAAIRTARRWDHRHPEVARVGRLLADRWEAEGEASLDADLDAAYDLWRRALIADPSRSWLRRRAEELRARRLGLDEHEEDA